MTICIYKQGDQEGFVEVLLIPDGGRVIADVDVAEEDDLGAAGRDGRQGGGGAARQGAGPDPGDDRAAVDASHGVQVPRMRARLDHGEA